MVDIKFIFYDLALSFDINLKKEWIKCIGACKGIYKALSRIETLPTLEIQMINKKGVN